MPTYISFGNHTQKGIENIKDSPKRAGALFDLMKSLGIEIKASYYTMGQYDFVLIFDAPTREAAMTLLWTLGSAGNVRTQTVAAITSEQGAKIINELSTPS